MPWGQLIKQLGTVSAVIYRLPRSFCLRTWLLHYSWLSIINLPLELAAGSALEAEVERKDSWGRMETVRTGILRNAQDRF